MQKTAPNKTFFCWLVCLQSAVYFVACCARRNAARSNSSKVRGRWSIFAPCLPLKFKELTCLEERSLRKAVWAQAWEKMVQDWAIGLRREEISWRPNDKGSSLRRRLSLFLLDESVKICFTTRSMQKFNMTLVSCDECECSCILVCSAKTNCSVKNLCHNVNAAIVNRLVLCYWLLGIYGTPPPHPSFLFSYCQKVVLNKLYPFCLFTFFSRVSHLF